MGRQQRTKQAEPEPMIGSSAHPHSGAHIGKRKANLERISARDGTAIPKPSPKGPGKGPTKRDSQGRTTGGFMSGRSSGGQESGERAAKRSKKSNNSNKKVGSGKKSSSGGKKSEGDEYDSSDDDIEGLKDENEDEDEDEALLNKQDVNLEAARSALFNDADLVAPNDSDDEELDFDRGSDDEDDEDEDEELEDDFGLGGDDDEEEDDDEDEDDEDVEGVTLDDFENFEMTAAEAEQMPASGKKAAKKAARAAYNSDDETTTMQVEKPTKRSAAKAPAPVEGGEEDDSAFSEGEEDSEDELEEGPLDDLRAVERRMRNSARILGNWKELGASSGKSRSDLVEQLVGDVCQYHGYTPYLAEKLFDLFGVDEALQFFNTSDTPRPLTLRVNTLKTRRRDLAQALINRGVNLEPLEGGWSKVGLQVFSGGGVPVGATPEYLAGHYILQSASSFLPVIALGPQPHERVLDMSAAPGGKTTYMSALMGNTGEVWANDSSRGRIKGLGGNIARLGCKNVIITNVDGREFPRIIGGFDRVLLDAPCSGTGVISKDQSVKVNKTERDFTLLSHLQKQLVLCAIDSVTPNSATGGYVVYSTCSVTTEENEAVVSYALRKRPHAKLVETGLAFGKEGFQRFRGKEFGKNMTMTRRFYPHVHNMDGFFVAKFKVGKPAKKVAEDDEAAESYEPLVEDSEISKAGASASAFDNDGDNELIAAQKKKYLKNIGVNYKKTKMAMESKK